MLPVEWLPVRAWCLALCNGKEEGCKVRELCKEFVDTFKAETGSYDCCEVKPKYFEPEIQCDKVVFKGAEILDKIVAREGLGK